MPLATYTPRAIRAAQLAGRRAARAGARKVEPEHLLVALLGDVKFIRPILAELKIDPMSLIHPARQLAGIAALVRRTKPRLSGRMEKILLHAEQEARSLSSRTIDVHHFLAAISREGGPAAEFLDARDATYDAIRRATRLVLHLRPPARCPDCGYDLRATPDRCPECGRLI